MEKIRNTQILLSKKWGSDFVKKLKVGYKKDGIAYVEHTQVTQRLIALIPDVQMEISNYTYDNFTHPETGEEKQILTGVTYTVRGTIDGYYRTVSEMGMCDKPFYNPDPAKNIKILNNGERGKEAISDAIKRCGMRFGIGIELYDTQAWLPSYLEPNKKEASKKEIDEKKPSDHKELNMVDKENVTKVIADLSSKKSIDS